MRAHIIIDTETIEDIDKLVGKRKRSIFIVGAVRDKLRQLKLLDAISETAGIFSDEDHPEWKTTKDVVNWVHELRKNDERRTKRLKFD